MISRRSGSRSEQGVALTRLLLLVVVPLLLLAVASYWYARGGRFASTDNAYVKADNIAISATIDGRVVSVSVDDNEVVEAGDVLFRLDARPHELKLRRTEARLEAVRNEIASLRAEHAQVSAEITDATQRVNYYRRQRDRRVKLANKGLATAADVDEIKYEFTRAVQNVRALNQKALVILASLGGEGDLAPEAHPDYQDALAMRDEANLAIEYTFVLAPAAGVVSKVALQAGEWVEEGQPVFYLLTTDELWVEANLKETQLTHVAEGHPVTLTIDAYPDHEWNARVTRISPATGSEFTVLPPQNATGNWVKVVQRVPVRIDLEPLADAPPLRVGMTARVHIDTGHERELLTLVRKTMASIRGGESR